MFLEIYSYHKSIRYKRQYSYKEQGEIHKYQDKITSFPGVTNTRLKATREHKVVMIELH